MPFSPQRRLKMEALFRNTRFLSLDEKHRLLLLSLLHYVDGKGREAASAQQLKELLYEFDARTRPMQIDRMLLALEEDGWVVLYEHDRRRYLQIVPWRHFVTVDGRDASNYPDPPPGPLAAQESTWANSGPTAAEGRGEGGEPPWLSDPDLPTPPGCIDHPNNTGSTSCGACGAALKKHRAVVAGEISKERALAFYLGSKREELSHDEATDLWRRRARAKESS